jgi:DNA repair exonuclease SbcCD ATPase subunit
LKDISDNEESIRKNAEIDASLNLVNEKIRLLNNTIKGINEQIAANNEAIKLNEKTIGENNKIIEVLEKEEKIIRNWRVYLDMVGKNGVCKTVLRKALPFINGELKSMLNGVCDFDVKVVIDNHNDVTFLLCHNGVEGGLGSGSGFEQTVASLALRCVLSKISSFSKPSFVVFDEILGGVADENYEQLKLLYDKIAKDYAFILQISHIKGLYEWHNHFIKVKKVDDVSVIENEL